VHHIWHIIVPTHSTPPEGKYAQVGSHDSASLPHPQPPGIYITYIPVARRPIRSFSSSFSRLFASSIHPHDWLCLDALHRSLNRWRIINLKLQPKPLVHVLLSGFHFLNLRLLPNPYYKGWVARDCLPSNPRRQSTWPIRDFRGGPPASALQAQCYMSFKLSFRIQRS
jgi:hypothetical protein